MNEIDSQTVDTSICRRSGASPEICICRYCKGRRRRGGLRCEQCGRQTDFLFEGMINPLAEDENGMPILNFKELQARYRPGGAPIPGMVCQRCRPASNLEKQEILEQVRSR